MRVVQQLTHATGTVISLNAHNMHNLRVLSTHAHNMYRLLLHTLCSQVLGEMGMAKKASERWLAYGVRELVAKRYPSVCIAYIDLENVGEANVSPRLGLDEQEPPSWDITCRIEAMERNRERGGKPHQLLRQYSVLLQYSSGQEHGSSPASKAAGVRELYRCALTFVVDSICACAPAS